MICKKCNNEIKDGEILCQSCGRAEPLMEERAKHGELLEREKTVLLREKKKPSFIIFTICLTAAALFNGLLAIKGNYLAIVNAAFMIIGCVGYWRAFAAKSGDTLGAGLKNASAYDNYNAVMFTLYAALSGIGGVGFGALLFVVAGSLPTSEITQLINILGWIVIVFGVLAMTVLLVVRHLYAKRRKSLLAFGKQAECGVYETKTMSPVGSAVIGGVIVLGGAISLGTYLVSATIIAVIEPLLNAFFSGMTINGAAELLVLLKQLLNASLGSLGFDALAQLTLGLFFIISGFWMSGAHSALMIAHAEVDRQNAIRLDLERKTKEAFEEWKKTHNTSPTEAAAESEMTQNAPTEPANNESDGIEPPTEPVNDEPVSESAPTESVETENNSDSAPTESAETDGNSGSAPTESAETDGNSDSAPTESAETDGKSDSAPTENA